ncbi:afadin- and alpha-actinin-binding protein B [Lingula anatina]|uniref:Afadin- and alpha-actinin-binding protein B n=1 Tax=Lingula anatina TaxID=7574 RepID=A0A1S3JXS6_LINAN|nr:afadin- and alpha-actinin-binding protein B [Lingula anatina]|eukprot:XP_013415215.1 afadin- and alpha-actinin-binding protein B [Lingula anatina]
MADWTSLGRQASPGTQDFLALYASKSRTPAHLMNGHQSSPDIPLQIGIHARSGALKNGAVSTGPAFFNGRGDKVDPFLTLPQRFSTSGNVVFCDRDNVDDCISYLNQELTTLGFPSLYHETSDTFDIVRLVNNTYELLQLQQKSLRVKEQLEDRQQRSESDLSHLQSTQNRLKDSLEQYEREISQSQERERQLVSKNKVLSKKVKAEKEEVKKLQSALSHKDVQYKHEVKKKERELNRLKDRLNQLLTDRSQERRIGMEILNSLQRADGKRSTWKTKTSNNKHEEDMYRLIVANYEDKQRELLVENGQLRQCLNDMQKELVGLLNGQPSPRKDQIHHEDSLEDSEDDKASVGTTSEFSDGYFQMPYEMVRDEIEKSLKDKWTQLKQRVRDLEKEQTDRRLSSESEKSNQEVEKLQQQILEYQEVIKQQEQLIQQSMQNTDNDSAFQDPCLLEEREALTAEKKLFNQQKKHFEEERKNFTEAAIRLGREKRAFEEEKARQLRDQFMSMTPFGSMDKSVSVLGSHSYSVPDMAKLTPANPVFSPLPERTESLKTPSTVDLYRTIGLIHDQHSSSSTTSTKRSPSPTRSRDSKNLSKSQSSSTRRSNISSNGRSSEATNSRPSSDSSQRIAEHVANVRLALFNKSGTAGMSGTAGKSGTGNHRKGGQGEDGGRNSWRKDDRTGSYGF